MANTNSKPPPIHTYEQYNVLSFRIRTKVSLKEQNIFKFLVNNGLVFAFYRLNTGTKPAYISQDFIKEKKLPFLNIIYQIWIRNLQLWESYSA